VLPAGVKLVKHGTKDPVVVTVTEPKEEEIVAARRSRAGRRQEEGQGQEVIPASWRCQETPLRRGFFAHRAPRCRTALG
jgi:hypothetical protein